MIYRSKLQSKLAVNEEKCYLIFKAMPLLTWMVHGKVSAVGENVPSSVNCLLYGSEGLGLVLRSGADLGYVKHGKRRTRNFETNLFMN